jgi:hypothetical protein
MPFPATGPTTLETVKSPDYLGIPDADDDGRLARIVAAVNDFVRTLPVSDKAYADTQAGADAAGWPARVVEGATMLVGRLWIRKDSPDGVAAVGDLGPVYVRRSDPDVAMLLEIGPDYATPAIG